ncbi:MAG: chemotaxis protein CheW [Oleispira antarctica]|uniref:CheW-like protein n=1 Tax=Oleispira antarctica RB-8 TaxID=698738 RepID=R4YL69_OLEAN|nr:chemotaxis protein CheW [Oleispira antarctica]MBQ0792502.1 chemotaxis protein CheW [Oleispira antarctica]CCK75426.1 CheW-like protein [Oleispira antarctica RB-8]
MTKQRSVTPLLVKETETKVNVVEGVLQNYLDQLLVTATQQPQKIEKVIKIPDEVVAVEAVAIELAPIEVAVVDDVPVALVEIPEIVIERISSPAAHIETAVTEAINTEPQTAPSLTDPESWSSQGVECLVFSVCGLKLAVPLLFLGGVHEITKGDVKPLVGQPTWYLGMVHTDEHNLQVIDTANLIMPERKQFLAEQGFKYLIQLEKTPWAIACQSIDDTVRLSASEIKWRGERGKRTWLAGTVIEKMCALIDVNGLLQHVDLSCKPV